MEYERSILVECTCKSIEEIPLDECTPLRITGKPKIIGEKKCSQCGKQIEIFASISIR